jgi:hypothetical protein
MFSYRPDDRESKKVDFSFREVLSRIKNPLAEVDNVSYKLVNYLTVLAGNWFIHLDIRLTAFEN